MYHIGICDDDLAFRNHIAELLHSKYAQQIHVHIFHGAIDLLHFIESSRTVLDILLLDIQMPHLNGIPAARQIRNLDRDMIIVLITSFDQYVLEGYEVQAFRYVMKPLEPTSFLNIFEHALSESNVRRRTKTLLIKTKSYIKRVPLSDILYIESNGRDKIAHTINESTVFFENLADLNKQLGPFGFYRTHKCFLVNMQHIIFVDKSLATIHVTGNHRVLISKKKIQPLLLEIQKYL